MGKSLLFFFLFGLGIVSVQGQKVVFDTVPLQVKKITEKDLQAYRDDPDFNYEVIKSDPTWWDNFLTWLGNLFLRLFEWLFGVERATGLLADFFSIVPYLLLGLFLFLLIKFFLNVATRSLMYAKKNTSSVTLSEEEHIIKNEDIQQLIKKAVAQKDYRLAFRYSYLHILKLLSEEQFIDWQLQKTNTDYISEIKAPELKQPFGHISQLYDYIWYGEFAIDKDKYEQMVPTFTALQNSIRKNG